MFFHELRSELLYLVLLLQSVFSIAFFPKFTLQIPSIREYFRLISNYDIQGGSPFLFLILHFYGRSLQHLIFNVFLELLALFIFLMELINYLDFILSKTPLLHLTPANFLTKFYFQPFFLYLNHAEQNHFPY
jgi:hypothetical protein